MQEICYNGYFVDADKPILNASNRGYRYGDGFFETIKIHNGHIALAPYHKQRIEHTIALLNYKLPDNTDIDTLFERIIELCERNKCANAARVRLSFSSGNGSLYDSNQPLHYLIEALPLQNTTNTLNVDGLRVDFFTQMKKNCDAYANLKTSSALLYTIAAHTANSNQWDDILILNNKNNICESSIANIFWIKDKTIYTPPLTEGCVMGIMRSYLIHSLKTVIETPCTTNELSHADEVFLTNAIKGIVWVKKIQNNQHYSNKIIKEIHSQYIYPLFY